MIQFAHQNLTSFKDTYKYISLKQSAMLKLHTVTTWFFFLSLSDINLVTQNKQ